MTCNPFRDHVEDLLDGLLPPEEAEPLEAHRDACASCAEQWAEAERFRDLLAREGRAALGAWEARRLAMSAATALPGEGAPPVVHGRFRVLRLAAAAAVIAAAGLVGSGLVSDSGPVALAYDRPTDLDAGQEATFGHDCRILVEDRAAHVTLRRGEGDQSADVVEMQHGVALFRLHPEHPLAVATPRGTARAVGATFVVDVRSDGRVSLDVVTGRVRLENGADIVLARSGERVEIDRGGAVHRISRDRIDEMEIVDRRRMDELADLRAEIEQSQRDLGAYAAAAQSGAITLADSGELQLDELGRALHTLNDRSLDWHDSRKSRATALFLLSGERMRSEFDGVEPMRAIEHPAFVAAVAEGYVAALAPEASEAARAAAVESIRTACAAVEADASGDALPTERAQSRQRALVGIIRTVDAQLGGAAAVQVIDAFRGSWDGARPTATQLDDGTVTGIVRFWKRFADLDDEQAARLADVARAYVDETRSVQTRLEGVLTAEEAEAFLYPRSPWGRGAPRGRSPGAGWGRQPGADDAGAGGGEQSAERTQPFDGQPGTGEQEDRPEPTASEIVVSRLKELDARLHVSEPRRLFERAIHGLLRPEQREKALGGPPRLVTFREKAGADGRVE